MDYLLTLLIRASVDTLYMTGMIILVGFILGFLREHSMANFQRSFGWKAVAITAVIGVPIHEMSHAIFCFIFRHKIKKVVLTTKEGCKWSTWICNIILIILIVYINKQEIFS